MFITNEYSHLIGNDCEDVILIPNKKFEAFEGDYIVTAYARILDANKNEIFLQAGEKIKGIGKVRKTRKKKVIKDGNKL